MFRRAILALTCLAVLLMVGVAATQSESPPLKSHHLFNLPDSITEADVAAAVREVNSAVAEAGYPDAGYRLWKVTGEQSGEYMYLWEGNWPNMEAYRSIHDHPAWLAAFGRNQSVFGVLAEAQVYNRFIELPLGN